jgi:Carbon-nitrogen hydrolase
MHKGFRFFSIILAVVLAIYFTWAGAGRKRPALDIRLEIDSSYVINQDAGKGNVVGINPYMIPIDYASEQHFYAKLDGYLQAAKMEGWLSAKTVVVFPEYIGTWLVVEGEKNSIYKSETINKALTTLVSSNFFSYMRAWFTSPDEVKDKIKYSVFASKGETIARIYRKVFSDLAKKYQVTIIGGSVLLPNPYISDDRIRVKKGQLYNVTAIFNPDGRMQSQLVKKSFPIQDEQPFIAQSPVSDIPVYNLPLGKTAVLICADSWFPAAFKSLEGKEPLLIAVPSYTQPDDAMNTLWKGYSGFPMPADVDSTDIGKITLRDAWKKYTLPSRIKSTTASYGMNVTLRGKLWDLGSDGEFIAVSKDSIFTGQSVKGASMVNMYLIDK